MKLATRSAVYIKKSRERRAHRALGAHPLVACNDWTSPDVWVLSAEARLAIERCPPAPSCGSALSQVSSPLAHERRLASHRLRFLGELQPFIPSKFLTK